MRLLFSICILMCLGAVSLATHAADVKRLSECLLSISGEIDKTTPNQVQTALKTCTGDNVRWVSFDSSGGDVQSALDVGHILRKEKAWTLVSNGSCASACVLAFLGGVHRVVVGRIGLHRAFPASASSTFGEVQTNRKKIDRLMREYLTGMNVPERLLFEMNAVSPGSIRWLDETELQQLQITGVDPVYADERDARKARQLGISMREYYARRQQGHALCGPRPRGTTEQDLLNYAKCVENVLQGKQ